MKKMVAVLLMAALAVLAVKLASEAPAIEAQIGAIFADAGAAPISPPLMYAGIRG